jgi:hypothetical protein
MGVADHLSIFCNGLHGGEDAPNRVVICTDQDTDVSQPRENDFNRLRSGSVIDNATP